MVLLISLIEEFLSCRRLKIIFSQKGYGIVYWILCTVFVSESEVCVSLQMKSPPLRLSSWSRVVSLIESQSSSDCTLLCPKSSRTKMTKPLKKCVGALYQSMYQSLYPALNMPSLSGGTPERADHTDSRSDRSDSM